jgi:dihydropteroate synthase
LILLQPPSSQSPASRGFVAFAPGARVRLCPDGILRSDASALAEGWARPLAGGPLAFTAIETIARKQSGGTASMRIPVAKLDEFGREYGIRDALASEIERIAAPRAPWAGLPFDRPLIMGILNVTPDSFSDGGVFFGPGHAIDHGEAMFEAGADIVDVGGESTRPGAEPIAPEEELRRVLPVIEALSATDRLLSIDTRRAAVMRVALEAGARIVNDVTALGGDPESMRIAVESGAAVVLMHMAGEPRTMQDSPVYDDVALDVMDYLEARIAACAAAGIPRERILVDPGIGFGKRTEHNLALLSRIALFHATGCGILLGASRKGFVGRVSRGEEPRQRVSGSIAAALWAADRGVQVFRVHDVAETRQAFAMRQAILGLA